MRTYIISGLLVWAAASITFSALLWTLNRLLDN